MSDSQEQPWSDNPNAPKIPYDLYFGEKATFAGILIGSMFYGTYKTFPPKRRPVDAHIAYSVNSRDRYRAILPLYGGAPRPRKSQEGGYQVGTRLLHRGHVLVCDRVHRDEPERSIHFLHR